MSVDVSATAKEVGRVAGIVIVVFALVNAVAEVASNWVIENRKVEVEQEANRRKDKLEISRLFFQSYLGAKPEQQTQVVQTLVALYPVEFRAVSPLFELNAASPAVEAKVRQAAQLSRDISAMTPDQNFTVKTVQNHEQAGFDALAERDLAAARREFELAYRIYPTYHNVDEIYRRVLTEAVVQEYVSASAPRKSAILRDVLTVILQKYSWGMNRDTSERLRRILASGA